MTTQMNKIKLAGLDAEKISNKDYKWQKNSVKEDVN